MIKTYRAVSSNVFLVMVTVTFFGAHLACAADNVVVAANDRRPPALENPSEVLRGTCKGKQVEVRFARQTRKGPQSESSVTVSYDGRLVADIHGSTFAHDWTAPNVLMRKTVFCSNETNFLFTAFGVEIAEGGAPTYVRSHIAIRDGAILAYLPPTKDDAEYIAQILHGN